MKKKGLIISTVVMVVVLIAALTTTTFAWFSVDNTTQISDMTVRVEAGSDVVIGVKNDGKYEAGATVDDFYTGTVTWGGDTARTWTAGTTGLGTELTTGFTFSLSQAVYTGTNPSTATMDAKGSWDPTHDLYAANAGDSDEVAGGTITKAIENASAASGTTGGQYLHLPLGISVAKSGFDKINCIITIDLSSNPRSTLGMNAALSYVYAIDKNAMGTGASKDTGNSSPLEFFSSSYNETLEAATTNNGIKTITVTEDGSLDPKTIYFLDLYIFINGYDDDCVTNATGSACAIKIEFKAESNE